MKRAQFSLAREMIAVAVFALGLLLYRWADRSAPGPVWAPLVGIYYFGVLLAIVLRSSNRAIRACRFGVVGLLIGLIPGCLFAVAEDLSAAQPSNAVELGSIICTGCFGTLVGFALGFFRTPHR